ncbi:MAG: HAMP domain-containing protein [Clostridiales bacterium]|jgi:two-component system sensor histidine kinase ArlS|nr:HAMP domain-containing protein [Clostridiales bacterium]
MNSNKFRFSIVYKLNSKLFFRLFVIFLALNLFILASFSVSLVIQGEHKINRVLDEFVESGLPNEESWLNATGYNITEIMSKPSGLSLPFNSDKNNPKSGARSFSFSQSSYNYEFEHENKTYRISIDYSLVITLFKRILQILIIFQLVILIGSIFSGANLIRRTLQPIADLAEVTHSLSTGRTFSTDEMEMLADKLDEINAAKLDTRISIDETQDELKSIAAAINGMLDRIHESYRSQIRFVSDASHELRTPISVIQGYANLLDRWGKDDEKTLQESIKAIKEESANMKGLIEQLLFLARGDSNTMTLQLEELDLSELAMEVFNETKMIDEGHEYKSQFEQVTILADKALIKQALRILIDNAIKYTEPGGTIKLAVREKDENVVIDVQDDGIGIPAEEIALVFERFYRADQSRSRSTGGTGLGLSIAKWIVERHGGHLEVLSRVGIGTKISIVIPKVSAGGRN